MAHVSVDGTALTCAQVVAVAEGRPVRLAASGRERARASMLAGNAAAGTRPLYGRDTGVGANRGVPVADADPAMGLLRSHATAAGPLRAPERVRATLVIRLNQLAAGGSGVDPQVLDGLARLLEGAALPPVRELGSVGTGDLSALATTALTLAGELPPLPPGSVVAEPVRFGVADALAFLSSNAATLADAALALTALRVSTDAAIVVAALSLVAAGGNLEAVDPGVERATPFPGAVRVARVVRALVGPDRPAPRRIQDPFAFRTLPQTLGPVSDAVGLAVGVTEALINTAGENPLLPADGPAIHHGGFQSTYLQLAADGVALAVAGSGPTAVARVGALLDPAVTGLSAFLADRPGASGLMVCEYVAASTLGDLRAAAVPAGLQTATLSRGVEDDASYASLATRELLTVAELHPTLVACELVTAVRALRMAGAVLVGDLRAALDRCTDALGAATADRDLTPDLAAATALLPDLAALAAGVHQAG